MRPTTLRLGALLAAASLAVHELRYRIAFGDAAGEAAEASGHGYLGLVTAVVMIGLAFALAGFVLQVTRPEPAQIAVSHRGERLVRPMLKNVFYQQ